MEVERYEYDDNGNRTSCNFDNNDNEPKIAIYNSVDHLEEFDGIEYQISDDVFLVSRGNSDTFEYGTAGE